MSPPSLTIGIIRNVLSWHGIHTGQFTRVGQWRGFICAWFAPWSQATAVARVLGPAAAVQRDPAGGWFLIVRYHTFAKTWRS